MQTSLWAELKAKYGWNSEIINVSGIDLRIYKRKIPIFGYVAYIPGCPPIENNKIKSFTGDIKKKINASIVRIEQFEQRDDSIDSYLKNGWVVASKNIQYRFTIQIDLTPSQDQMFANLKSRGRYEVKKAEAEGVKVESVETSEENFKTMYELLKVTSKRNKFYIRDLEFMQGYWGEFANKGKLKLFFAYHNSKVVAGAVVLVNDRKAWYKDGGSLRDGTQIMAPRLLHWQIAKSLKNDGIETYDLGGIPDPDKHHDSSMHGIYVFKSAYAKNPTIFMPTLDLPLKKVAKLFPVLEKQWLRVYNTIYHEFWW